MHVCVVHVFPVCVPVRVIMCACVFMSCVHAHMYIHACVPTGAQVLRYTVWEGYFY